MKLNDNMSGMLREHQPNFPAGLFQPEGSYRFGLEALLLGALGARVLDEHPFLRQAVIELGCGCGAALLGLALLRPQAACMGLDREDTLVAAAIRNADILGLGKRIEFATADITDRKAVCSSFNEYMGSCSLVIANPPWRKDGNGKKSAHELRERAMCATPGNFSHFCRCAHAFLIHHGFFCVIIPPGMLVDALGALSSEHLGVRSILPVSAFIGQPARRVLLTCQKNASHDPTLEFPLVLHHRQGQNEILWTSEAMQFCPWLDRHTTHQCARDNVLKQCLA